MATMKRKAERIIAKLPIVLKQRLRKYNTTLEDLIDNNEGFYLEPVDIFEMTRRTRLNYELIRSVLLEYGIAKEITKGVVVYYLVDYYYLKRLLEKGEIK